MKKTNIHYPVTYVILQCLKTCLVLFTMVIILLHYLVGITTSIELYLMYVLFSATPCSLLGLCIDAIYKKNSRLLLLSSSLLLLLACFFFLALV